MHIFQNIKKFSLVTFFSVTAEIGIIFQTHTWKRAETDTKEGQTDMTVEMIIQICVEICAPENAISIVKDKTEKMAVIFYAYTIPLFMSKKNGWKNYQHIRSNYLD